MNVWYICSHSMYRRHTSVGSYLLLICCASVMTFWKIWLPISNLLQSSVCSYMCVCMCILTCVRASSYMYIIMCVHLCACMCVYVHAYICMHVFACAGFLFIFVSPEKFLCCSLVTNP